MSKVLLHTPAYQFSLLVTANSHSLTMNKLFEFYFPLIQDTVFHSLLSENSVKICLKVSTILYSLTIILINIQSFCVAFSLNPLDHHFVYIDNCILSMSSLFLNTHSLNSQKVNILYVTPPSNLSLSLWTIL